MLTSTDNSTFLRQVVNPGANIKVVSRANQNKGNGANENALYKLAKYQYVLQK